MAIKTDNMIFVFGSNLAGIHGAGAARFAREHRGAQMGIGVGRTGQCYAIPTKGIKVVEAPRRHRGNNIQTVGETLPLVTIKQYINDFLFYAANNLSMSFQVTCIGCGLAGFSHEDIAPMFEDAPGNCWFDEAWKPWLTKAGHRFWGTF